MKKEVECNEARFKEAKVTKFIGKNVRVLARDKMSILKELNEGFIKESNPFYVDFITMKSLKVNCYKINYDMDINEVFKDSKYEEALKTLQAMNSKNLQGSLTSIINHFGYKHKEFEFFSKLIDSIIEIQFQIKTVTHDDECAITSSDDVTDKQTENENDEQIDETETSEDNYPMYLTNLTHRFLGELGVDL